jgi:hypothetical protein
LSKWAGLARLGLPRSSDGGAEFEELGLDTTIVISTEGAALRADAAGRCEYGDDAVKEST